MAARPPEAGRWRDEPESRRWTKNERCGRRSAEMRATARAARTGLPGSGPTCLLHRAPGPEIGYPGYPALLRPGIMAEQESFRSARLPGGLSRPG